MIFFEDEYGLSYKFYKYLYTIPGVGYLQYNFRYKAEDDYGIENTMGDLWSPDERLALNQLSNRLRVWL